jgi:hypothetical protein
MAPPVTPKSLALSAEHTFGHSESVSHPWNLLAGQLRLKKLSYAANAADEAEILFDQAGEFLGGGPLSYDRLAAFRVINPFPWPLSDLVELEFDACELKRWNLEGAVHVSNKTSGQRLPHQLAATMRGKKVLVDLAVGPNETIDLLIEPGDSTAEAIDVRTILPDATRDIRVNDVDVPPAKLRTKFVGIQWTAPQGITHWIDLATGQSLIDADGELSPFTISASRLCAKMDGQIQRAGRRKLGRNRNGLEAEWNRSRLLRAVSGFKGEHLNGVVLDYTMPGFEFLQVTLSAHKHRPRVDIEMRMHKIGTWDAENVYLALPFSSGPGAELWLDRGAAMRPGKDQLPGTLIDYYGVQDGFAWCKPKYGVAVAQLDSHLIQLGPLQYGVRDLAGEVPANWRSSNVHAWLMTNYWDTNFSPELGGFYSFRFSILWGESLSDPSNALRACRDSTMGLRAIRLR